MAYATAAQFREYHEQVGTDQTTTARIEAILERASSLVEGRLGFQFAAYPSEASPRDLLGPGTQFLRLPPHQAGSASAAALVLAKGYSSESSSALGDWAVLASVDQGITSEILYRELLWREGSWYRVTAKWGVGPAPASVVEVVLELAVNIWQGKQAGKFSDVVGVESGPGGSSAVGYEHGFTNLQKQALADVRRAYFPAELW